MAGGQEAVTPFFDNDLQIQRFLRRREGLRKGGFEGASPPPFPTNPSPTRAKCELAAGVTNSATGGPITYNQ